MPLCRNKEADDPYTQRICFDHQHLGGEWCQTLLWNYTRERGVTRTEWSNGLSYVCNPWVANGCCNQNYVNNYPPCPASSCSPPPEN